MNERNGRKELKQCEELEERGKKNYKTTIGRCPWDGCIYACRSVAQYQDGTIRGNLGDLQSAFQTGIL
jgi:hypothetical protein